MTGHGIYQSSWWWHHDGISYDWYTSIPVISMNMTWCHIELEGIYTMPVYKPVIWQVFDVSHHLDPWHPDIVCRTFDIERNIRYRRLLYRMLIRYRRFLHSISYIDIECVRYQRSHYSISKVTYHRYQRLWKGLSISKFRFFDIEHKSFDIVLWYRIRYWRPFSRHGSISNVMSFDIER